MGTPSFALLLRQLLLMLIHMAAVLPIGSSFKHGLNLGIAKASVSEAKAYCYSAHDDQQLLASHHLGFDVERRRHLAALSDCAKMYEEAEPRLDQLMTASPHGTIMEHYAGIWLSSVLTSHRTCFDGLEQIGTVGLHYPCLAPNLTRVLTDALAFLYLSMPASRHRSTNKVNPTHVQWAIEREQKAGAGGETRWHKTGKTRVVLVNGKHKGCKKILVLYTNFGKNMKSEKTSWVMHQYHLGLDEEEKDGELVVSKIFYQTQPNHPSKIRSWILG